MPTSNIRFSRSSRPRTVPGAQGLATVPLVCLLTATAAVLVGCGGGSTDSLDEFTGTWTIDTDSTFTLQCPGMADVPDLSLWTSEMMIAPGPVSDLVETNGACQFRFDVAGKVASVAEPDPVTGAPPTCSLQLNLADTTGNEVLDDVVIQPIAGQWLFRLELPVKGKPPGAQVLGSANWTETRRFVNGMTTTVGPCTYVVAANLTKLANR
jgi:hypothetical protein